MQRDENLAAIGKRIREARKKAGLSQEELAERLDLSRNYIGMVERGERNPTLLTLLRFSATLDIHPGWLFDSLR